MSKSRSWRRTQKETIKYLGGQEVGKDKVDGTHPLFLIEVKHRKNLPGWVTEALKQAGGYAISSQDTRSPLVIIKEKGKHTKHALVFMWLKDFEDWTGNVEFDGRGLA